MRIRIRFTRGRPGRHFALATAVLLTAAAVIAVALALWRIAADLNWASSFAIPSGLFSHWQVWLAGAVLLQLCSRVLTRYGRGRNRATG